jgi:hypothetical protein
MSYFVEPYEDLPSHDFNREIIPPGCLDHYPDGAIGVRADDDFWAVAALPYEKYLNVSIEEIVSELWPECPEPSYGPDVPFYKAWT